MLLKNFEQTVNLSSLFPVPEALSNVSQGTSDSAVQAESVKILILYNPEVSAMLSVERDKFNMDGE